MEAGEMAAMKEHAEDWIASGAKHGKRAARNVLLLLAEVERLRKALESPLPPAPGGTGVTSTRSVLEEIFEERSRQDRRWGPQRHSSPEWMAILGEEFGEACSEANDLYFSPDSGPTDAVESPRERKQRRLRRELVQVAAVAVASIENLDNGEARVT